MKKKLTCLILSIMLVLTLLPFSAQAAIQTGWSTLSTAYNPYNMIMDQNGNTYVASDDKGNGLQSGQHGIMKYNSNGSPVPGFANALDGKHVTSMCFDSHGDILTGILAGCDNRSIAKKCNSCF